MVFTLSLQAGFDVLAGWIIAKALLAEPSGDELRWLRSLK